MIKKYQLSFVLIFVFCTFSFSQNKIIYSIQYDNEEITHDTLSFTSASSFSKPLIGTDILYSTKTISAQFQDIFFEKVTISECKQTDFEKLAEVGLKEISFSKDNNHLIIELQITDNCCFDFLCEIEKTEDDILDLYYTGYGSYCSCNCCFGLTYYITVYDKELLLKKIRVNKNNKKIIKI